MRRVIASLCSVLIVASLGVATGLTAAHATTATTGATSFSGKPARLV